MHKEFLRQKCLPMINVRWRITWSWGARSRSRRNSGQKLVSIYLWSALARRVRYTTSSAQLSSPRSTSVPSLLSVVGNYGSAGMGLRCSLLLATMEAQEWGSFLVRKSKPPSDASSMHNRCKAMEGSGLMFLETLCNLHWIERDQMM